MLRTLSGATIRRVIDRSNASVPEHAHDRPLLSLFVVGRYLNETELGTTYIQGPSAIFYRAGSAHRNEAGPAGFEQVEIEFDPDWLGCTYIPAAPVSRWIGGCVAAESRSLAQACFLESDVDRLRNCLRQFIRRAGGQPVSAAPVWLNTVTRHLHEDPSWEVCALAREVRLHPSWLGVAYRQYVGEGLRESAARLRVERATHLLRETDRTPADIAQEAGFCDQSHMHRVFRRVLGRLPSDVRSDRANFRQVRVA